MSIDIDSGRNGGLNRCPMKLNVSIDMGTLFGNPSDLTVTVCEKSVASGDTFPNCASMTGPTTSLPLTLTWKQDQNGNLVDEFDIIDVQIISNGPDNAVYIITADDYGYVYTTGKKDQAFETQDFTNVPEFSTIAIPIAAVLGLVFFFQQKKNKKE